MNSAASNTPTEDNVTRRSHIALREGEAPDLCFQQDPIKAFAHLFKHRVNGLLEVVEESSDTAPGAVHRLWLKEGMPAAIEASSSALPLLTLLRRLPGVGAMQLEEAAALCDSDEELASVAVAADIVSMQQLQVARDAQQLRELDMLFALPATTTFRVFCDAPPASVRNGASSTAMDPRVVFLRAARQTCNHPTVENYIARLEGTSLRTSAGFDDVPDSFSAAERQVAERLTEGVTVAELVDEVGDLQTVHNVVFALSMSHCVGRISQLPPPLTARPTTPVPVSRKTLRAAQRASRATPITSRKITPAIKAYTDENRSFIIASRAFSDAEGALRTLDHRAAARHIDTALAYAPDNPTYQAMQAFLQAEQKFRGGEGADVQPEIVKLGLIIAAHPSNELAYYSRARLHKRLNKRREALKDFAAAAKLNPHNSHAVAEARTQPRRGTQSKPEPTSVLARWFKRSNDQS